MEGMFSFVGIIIIVFGILQIILFFKMWGMTNDIKDIRNKYINSPVESIKNNTSNEVIHLYPGALVTYIFTGEEMKITGFNEKEGKYICYAIKDNEYKGEFSKSEIKLTNS